VHQGVFSIPLRSTGEKKAGCSGVRATSSTSEAFKWPHTGLLNVEQAPPSPHARAPAECAAGARSKMQGRDGTQRLSKDEQRLSTAAPQKMLLYFVQRNGTWRMSLVAARHGKVVHGGDGQTVL